MSQKYPKYSLEEALSVASAVYKQNKQCKVITAATALGYKPSTSGFIQKKASAKWYGLIQEENDLLNSTSITTKIMSPYDEQEKTTNLQIAFNTFELFKELLDHIPYDVVLTKDRIATLAERECEIQVDNKEAFVEIFVDGATFCGLLDKIDDNTIIKKQENTSFDVNLKTGETVISDKTREENQVEIAPSITTNNSTKTNNDIVQPTQSLTINLNINIDSSTPIELICELMKQISTLNRT